MIQTLILRRKQVQAATGYSSSTIARRINAGLFPKPFSLGPRLRGWTDSEIERVNNGRVASFTDPELRDLVQDIERGRRAHRETHVGPTAPARNGPASPLVNRAALPTVSAAGCTAPPRRRTSERAVIADCDAPIQGAQIDPERIR